MAPPERSGLKQASMIQVQLQELKASSDLEYRESLTGFEEWDNHTLFYYILFCLPLFSFLLSSPYLSSTLLSCPHPPYLTSSNLSLPHFSSSLQSSPPFPVLLSPCFTLQLLSSIVLSSCLFSLPLLLPSLLMSSHWKAYTFKNSRDLTNWINDDADYSYFHSGSQFCSTMLLHDIIMWRAAARKSGVGYTGKISNFHFPQKLCVPCLSYGYCKNLQSGFQKLKLYFIITRSFYIYSSIGYFYVPRIWKIQNSSSYPAFNM